MNFDEKYAFAMRELEQSSISPANHTTLLVLLARKFGVQLPPPHYASFITNTLVTGGFFGVLWGTLMYFLIWKDQHTVGSTVKIAAIGGLCFGLAMACYYKYSAQKNQLTPWSEI